jgi:hypothetical protein
MTRFSKRTLAASLVAAAALVAVVAFISRDEVRIESVDSTSLAAEALDAKNNTTTPVLVTTPGDFARQLIIDAHNDPRASAHLSALISLCTTIEHGGRDDRFNHPWWSMYADECVAVSTEDLMDALRSSAKPQTGDWLRLQSLSDSLSDPTLEDLAARDEAALHLIRTSDDPELVAVSALIYFDLERIRSRAEGQMSQAVAIGNVAPIAQDLALTIACRTGRDCGPLSLSTIGECAAIRSCSPGTSLLEVIRYRQSAQDFALIERLANEATKGRRRGSASGDRG